MTVGRRHSLPASLLLFLAIAAPGWSQDAPCTAMTTVPVPCAEPSKAAQDVVASLEGEPIHLSDLDEATRKEVAGIEDAVVAARRKALRREIEVVLFELEAARLHVDARKLAYEEMRGKVPAPSAEEVKGEIAAHPETYKAAEDAGEQAASALHDRALASRHESVIASLEKRFPVTMIDLSGPPPAGGTVVANVGRRKVLASDVWLNVEAEAAKARASIRKHEQTAVQRVAHERLVAREAARRGIAPGDLVRLEVTAKVAPVSDDAVKARWEKFKGRYDSDLAKAQPKVREDLAASNREAAEQAFDDVLRKGHETALLFQVPDTPAVRIDVAKAAFSGPEHAKVTLVEFGDYQCPPCGRMSKIVDEVLAPYGSQVRYVFLQFPMDMHKYAWKAAEAALAARSQGKFFPYAHQLFTHQDALDVASLKKYAAEAGLDVTKFEQDLDTGRFASQVFEERRRGELAGVPGTPMFFLNGVLQGRAVYSTEGLRSAIEKELENVKR
ncbi:MAG: nhaA2 [Acidobacteria bacterium]|nr:nhaA2 [Acidobacteriota bacterium]